MAHMDESSFNNAALTEMYLPGYYQQMEYMKTAFRKKDSAEEEIL